MILMALLIHAQRETICWCRPLDAVESSKKKIVSGKIILSNEHEWISTLYWLGTHYLAISSLFSGNYSNLHLTTELWQLNWVTQWRSITASVQFKFWHNLFFKMVRWLVWNLWHVCELLYLYECTNGLLQGTDYSPIFNTVITYLCLNIEHDTHVTMVKCLQMKAIFPHWSSLCLDSSVQGQCQR